MTAATYRDRCNESDTVTFSSLDERDVVDFARREAARTIGPSCDARFFLAGGMFKTLLTGRPASGLDLWAPSARDRALVLAALTRRGARRLEDRPFADAFAIDGRIVVLPHEVEPDTLDRRLARFDVALSAVGVEHRPGGRWSAVVHPLARTSVERREVLLLKPLVNRRLVLSTLERMRRYADELGYTTPAEEEAELWRVFESQPEDMKREMLARYERTARGGYGVRGEAARRSR